MRETVVLAAPLAVAQLSQMAMNVTDTIMVGALGPDALAAGGLGNSLFFTLVVVLQAVLTPVSTFVAHARGGLAGTASGFHRVGDIYMTGLLLGGLLSIPAFLLLGRLESVLLWLGEPPALAHDAGDYVRVLRWSAPGALAVLGLMRAYLTAVERGRLLLVVALAAVGLNGLLNYGLIHGAWGLPRLGLIGSATATACTFGGMAMALFARVHLPPTARQAVAGGRVRLALMRELLRLGWPVAVMQAVEVGLFLATGLLVGRAGPAALAAHQIALTTASTIFMVPLAVGQAANVRVGFWAGAGRPAQARRAGAAALWLAGAFMALAGAVLLLAPRAVVGVFLDVGDPANAPTVAIAVTLLAVAALFQVADGVQTTAAGALRGLRDVRAPMLIAAFGYWGLGFAPGVALAFPAGMGPVGLWLGLAAGVISVACLLTLRFHRLSRLDLPILVRQVTDSP